MSPPLYQQIFDRLVEQIHHGRYEVGQPFPSEKEILESFGVSRITAIHVLNDLEQAGYIKRKRGVGNQLVSVLGRPPLAAIPSPTPATKLVGLIVPFLSYPNAQPEHFQYVQGVNDYLLQGEYRTVIYSRNDTFDERALLQKARADGCEGIICHPEALHYILDLLHRMAAEGYPFVLLDHSLPSLPVPVIGPNNRQAQKDLVTHLIQAGHRKILHYSFEGLTGAESVYQRYLGYDDALREAGIYPSPDWTCIVKSADCRGRERVNSSTQEQLDDYIWQLLKQQLDDGCTAICTINDYEAVHLSSLLSKKGVDLHTVTVAGFDGLSIARNAPVPPVTTRQDFYTIGYRAAEELLAVLTTGKTGYFQHQVPNLGIVDPRFDKSMEVHL